MPSSLSFSQWRSIALAGYGPTLASSIGFGAIGPLVALTARELGASVSLAAFIVGLIGVGTLIGDLPAGIIADRAGEKSAIIGACLVDAAMLGIICLVPHLWVLGGCVFVVGLAGSVFGIARQSFLTEAVPPQARGRALSSLGGAFRIGYLIGPLCGAAIISRWGMPSAYGFAAAMSLVAAGITFALPDLPRESEQLSHDGVAEARLTQVLRDGRKALLTVGIGCLVIQLVRSARQAIIPLWCDYHQVSPATTSLIYAASMAMDVLLFFPGGYLMDRLGRWWMCVPPLTLMSIGLGVLTFSHTASWITAAAMLLGFANGVSSGIVMTLGSDNSPAVGRTKFLAGFRLFGDTGASLGPLAITVITGFASLATSAWVLMVLGLAGAAWLTTWVPRARPAPRTRVG